MKNKLMLGPLVLTLLFGLSACGGGGGDGGGSDNTAANGQTSSSSSSSGGAAVTPVISFMPDRIMASTTTGANVYKSLNFTVTSNVPMSTAPSIVIEDPTQILSTPDLSIAVTSQSTAAVTMRLQPNLPLGTLTGSLRVHVYTDQTFKTEYAGSPVELPYSISVICNDLPGTTPYGKCPKTP